MKLINTLTTFSAKDLYGGGTAPATIDLGSGIGNQLPLDNSVRLVGGVHVFATAGATVTVRLYMAISGTKTSKIFEGVALAESGLTSFYVAIPEIPVIISAGSVNDLIMTIQSNNEADTSASGEMYLYDASKGLDIATVNSETPVSAADVGDEIDARVLSTTTQGTLGNWIKKLMGKR